MAARPRSRTRARPSIDYSTGSCFSTGIKEAFSTFSESRIPLTSPGTAHIKNGHIKGIRSTGFRETRPGLLDLT